MGLIALDCTKCGARLEVSEENSTYTCKYCHAEHERALSENMAPTPSTLQVMAERSIANEEYGRAMQFIEQGLSIDPHHVGLQALNTKAQNGLASLSESRASQTAEELQKIRDLGEAEQYYIQAEFINITLQANRKVYGSNNGFSVANPADVDLALQYIERSLELFPENPVYLNLKALLLWEGKGDKESAAVLFQKAAALSPRDINIQNNLNALTSSSCFVATAAFGTPFACEVALLRSWRDNCLLMTMCGKWFVTFYYRISPPIASFIATRPILMRLVRLALMPLVARLKKISLQTP